MFIKILDGIECVRIIDVDEKYALEIFNLILLHLGEHEKVIMYSDENESHVIAVGC